ncbi:hypothetical protein COMA1_70145 [Candidatus Nitrospira nitrosa]|uniref:Uncharacterized protein n=1 Tax=Candidatus Nitrospira nitrosa TaxID=1742972 RepID=A0A0S4LP69_9BACT|nr:hypothetical protein COMA1_70145 [Candidatus Nitrospira nitrosa]
MTRSFSIKTLHLILNDRRHTNFPLVAEWSFKLSGHFDTQRIHRYVNAIRTGRITQNVSTLSC